MIDEKMKAWCARHEHTPAVVSWLKENPPPEWWIGTPLEYAYCEMFGAPE